MPYDPNAPNVPIDEVVLTWTGFPGAPGYTVLHTGVDQHITDQWRDFLLGIATIIPNTVRVAFPTSGRRISATTGDQTGVWAGPATPDFVGAGTGVYAGPVGLCLNWATQTLHAAHFIKGRTYIVPLVQAMFSLNGTLDDTTLGVVRGHAGILLGAVDESMRIWSRPIKFKNAADGSDNTRNGASGEVKAVSVPDKAIVLRSRRD